MEFQLSTLPVASATSSLNGYDTTAASHGLTPLVAEATTAAPVGSTTGVSTVFITNLMKWVYMAVGILGIFCNAFVIYVIGRSRALQQHPRNWLIFNQSLADLLSAVVLLTVVTRTTNTDLQGTWGWIVCIVWYSSALLWICYVTSEYILLALTFEVYLAIVHPILHKNMITTRRLVATVVVIWLGSIVYQFAYNIATGRVINGVCYNAWAWSGPAALPAYAVVNFIIKLFCPAAFFAFCYIRMALTLKKSVKVAPALEQDMAALGGAAPHDTHQKARRNIYYTLSYSLLLHVATWAGNQFEFLMYGFGFPLNATSLSYQLPLLAIYTSSFINPIVYVIKYERFRHAVLASFQWLKRSDKQLPPSTVFTTAAHKTLSTTQA